MSGNKALDDGAAVNKPRPGPRRTRYHSAGSSTATALGEGCEGRGVLLMFQVNAPSFPSLLGNLKTRGERGSLERWKDHWARVRSPDSQDRVAVNPRAGIAKLPPLLSASLTTEGDWTKNF